MGWGPASPRPGHALRLSLHLLQSGVQLNLSARQCDRYRAGFLRLLGQFVELCLIDPWYLCLRVEIDRGNFKSASYLSQIDLGRGVDVLGRVTRFREIGRKCHRETARFGCAN